MSVVDCRDVVVDREMESLIVDLAGSASTEIVREVVWGARRDLDGQIPAEAMPELLHRSAVQRLINRGGGDR